jgi:hypothetical protein
VQETGNDPGLTGLEHSKFNDKNDRTHISMKICPQCGNSPWPFAMVLFIAAIIAFLTWLMLSFAGADALEAAIGTAVAFVAVGATLVHYVLGCMRRHCRHGPGAANPDHHHHGGTPG